MAKRFKMSKGSSKRYFKKTASVTHKKNLNTTGFVMRGGVRL